MHLVLRARSPSSLEALVQAHSMPKVAKKTSANKSTPVIAPLDVLDEHIAAPPPIDSHAHADALIEPRTPAHSPTRPHIGYFGRSSCPCWRCVRNMGPLQRRKECDTRGSRDSHDQCQYERSTLNSLSSILCEVDVRSSC